MYVCGYVCMYEYMHFRMYVCMHACKFACKMHACMHICKQTLHTCLDTDIEPGSDFLDPQCSFSASPFAVVLALAALLPRSDPIRSFWSYLPPMFVRVMHVCVCMCACVRACMRACVRVCACTMCAYTTQKSSLQSSNFLNCRARIFTRGRNYVISQILCYNLGTERNRIHGTFARKREQVRERKKERDKRESRAPKCYQKANMYAQILNWQRIYACVNIYVYIHEICISDNCMINACVCVYI